ncbi:uncharacterized protein BDR25DRAFT_330111 [Lindgomyces ingoldianus]|uniref:Uncharacterized protein n=1 Tax=Lindgomyces ingoldianus TaxID=673940 RepID=A0ACB6Q8G5_9PLEO|nr:uncharacterized protein BDR25DRAFT_330111 [Lindgomyces ingoldianus]KAF2462657.1 hypothetical protein BDR25DRAFT_330111 [Lindgomyces ingoldianus]
MDPLSITASTIGILQLSSKVIETSTKSKIAPKDRAQCAIEASNLRYLLTMLKNRLGGTSNEPWYKWAQELGRKDGPLDQYKLALEQLQGKITRQGGIKNIRQLLLGKFIKGEIMELMTRIARLTMIVQVALEMGHLLVLCLIKNSRPYRKLSQAIGKGQSDFIARRQEGAGLWFLNPVEYFEWIQGSQKTLFCPGIPCAGKTMMAAITIDHLLGSVHCNDTGVAYLYCNYKAQADQTTTNLLAAILKQLVQGRPSAAEPVVCFYNYHIRYRTKSLLEEVSNALHSVLTSCLIVYLVVDAWDECSNKEGTRSQLLNKLHDLQTQTDLQLMVTSPFILAIVSEI